MDRIDRAIALLCQGILWISTSIIFAILAVNTILRYASGASLQWANEMPELLFPWLVMSGVVLAAQHGAHITTSFLLDKLAPAARAVLLGMGWLIVALLYFVLAWATFNMLEIVHDERSPILHVPGSITYGCVMVGLLLLAIIALRTAWMSWRKPAPMPDAPAAVHW
jgi:TRAP-type transport system small permease protein